MLFPFAPKKNWQEKILERVFKNRKLCREKLLPFGCIKKQNGFLYGAELLDGMLRMEFDIHADGSVAVNVYGDDGKESDMLRLLQRTPTSYLGKKFRKEYEEELWHVAECCFEPDAFKGELTLQIIAHIKATYGDELEFLWRKFPENAIIRRRDNKKWYAVFAIIPRLKLIGDSEERMEVLNLRVYPEELKNIVDNVSRFPGYHMNKKNWISLCLDGSISFEELAERIEISYQLAKK